MQWYQEPVITCAPSGTSSSLSSLHSCIVLYSPLSLYSIVLPLFNLPVTDILLSPTKYATHRRSHDDSLLLPCSHFKTMPVESLIRLTDTANTYSTLSSGKDGN